MKYVEVERYGYRYIWPFKDMEIGDVLIFSPDMGPRARDAAHCYGRRTGKRFRTRGGLGCSLWVERISLEDTVPDGPLPEFMKIQRASPEQFERAAQLADARDLRRR